MCKLATTEQDYTEIGRAVGCSREYVRQIAEAMAEFGVDLQSYRQNAVHRNYALSLRAADLLRTHGNKEVATILGCNLDWVKQIRREYQIPDRQLTEKQDSVFAVKLRCLALLINTDKTQSQIAEELQMSMMAVSRLAQQAREAGLCIPKRSTGARRVVEIAS